MLPRILPIETGFGAVAAQYQKEKVGQRDERETEFPCSGWECAVAFQIVISRRGSVVPVACQGLDALNLRHGNGLMETTRLWMRHWALVITKDTWQWKA